MSSFVYLRYRLFYQFRSNGPHTHIPYNGVAWQHLAVFSETAVVQFFASSIALRSFFKDPTLVTNGLAVRLGGNWNLSVLMCC